MVVFHIVCCSAIFAFYGTASVFLALCANAHAKVLKTTCASYSATCGVDPQFSVGHGNSLVQMKTLLASKRLQTIDGDSENRYEKSDGVGTWGGWCVCPDGQQYNVGDNGDACASLACVGGTSGECNRSENPARRGMRVVCGVRTLVPKLSTFPAPPQEVGKGNTYAKADGVGAWGGWCTCPDGERYNVGDNNDVCGSLACVGGTAGECAQNEELSRAGMRVVCRNEALTGAFGPQKPNRNRYERAAGVGGWGGWCTCPDGHQFNVGDNGDACGSLACIGGVPGQCNTTVDPQRTGMRVLCAPRPVPVWDSPVARHGHLRVDGNRILDENGSPVYLQGASFWWSQYAPQYYNSETVQWLKNDWRVSVLRAPVAVDHVGHGTQPELEKPRIESVVNAAIAEGLYIIIAWGDHVADEFPEQAKTFFEDLALKYGGHPNVLFEVMSETERQDWSTALKPYHEALVSTIRQHTQNLIILGTPSRCQEVDVAASDPVIGDNLVYAVNFFAGVHKQEARNRITNALRKDVALFATQWGTCDWSQKEFDLQESQIWLKFLARYQISHANYAIGDNVGRCATLKSGTSANVPWALESLTGSGKFIRAWIRGEGNNSEIPSSPCDR